MPLSEYEQRVLEQMERQLTSDDPKLVNTFQGGRTSSVRRWLLTGAGALAGLTVLVVGAATSQPWIGVLGFVAMFVSVVLAFSPPRRQGPAGVVTDSGTVRPRSGKRPSAGSPGFITRFEQRWDRRRDERGR
ncbi:DUF3040 domain-containing protein [Actinotalea subterranea]|uniref:DUF3040 domain-containing protein n=1 Tax=Actinotalea subterranea TaxID=2607497 RepID=UPI0011EC54C2|nr:DUF3040 domain-containing protein [Actinotalea subterranea]